MLSQGTEAGPSIKGAVFEPVVADVRRLVAERRVPREAIEVRLEAPDLQILDEKVLASSWYPIESHARLMRLLMEVEGGGRTDYLVQRGRRAAERLFDAGLYAQLRWGERRAAELRQTRSPWTEEDGQRVTDLAGMIFSFGQWGFTQELAGSVYRIDVRGAEAFPEVAGHAVRGFLEYAFSRLMDAPFAVEYTRPGAGRVRFTLRRTEARD